MTIMKPFQTALRIFIPVLFLLASLTSKATITFDTIAVPAGQCRVVLDSVVNNVLIYIDSFTVITQPANGFVYLSGTGNGKQVIYCDSLGAADYFIFSAFLGLSQPLDTFVVYVNNGTCSFSYTTGPFAYQARFSS